MGLLTRADGMVAATPEEQEWAHQAGYVKCYTQRVQITGKWYGQPCPFWISLEGQHHIEKVMGGYYTCPLCKQSYDLLVNTLGTPSLDPTEAEENWRRDQETQPYFFRAGGATYSGLTPGDHGQTGEDIVYKMGQIPGYGKITWWHHGGASSNSPLDGATADWGIEVKTIDYSAKHHRFMTATERPRDDGTVYYERAEKMKDAIDSGKKGVLGVLVLLDYRRSVADVYVREFPARPNWEPTDHKKSGITNFRSGDGSVQHLVAEVPIHNPLMDPHDPQPVSPSSTSAFGQQQPDMPF
jgi:hypothetical protein